MKFDLEDIPLNLIRSEIEIGDVFTAKGGKGETAMWVVVAINQSNVHMLGVDESGEVISTTSYGAHALRNRFKIGVIPAIKNLKFKITME